MNQVLVVSDGTGRTARQALNAALTQFPGIDIDVIVHADIRTQNEIRYIVTEALKSGALIVHTLVTDSLREFIIRESHANNVETIDLMGPLLTRLSSQFIHEPSQQPGLYHKLNKEYFQRIDSMQFAFNHDDGQRTESLNEADIILLGVSRTFKTPISIYLAYKGWFAANVPIIMGLIPPEELNHIDPSKVFCLTTSASRLSELRKTRNVRLGGNIGNYSEPEYVSREINFANRFYNLHPSWTLVNVTSKSIEEIASEILAIMAGRKR
ncbi:MAG: pyruvate, water dikinase regulatory protein [Bacteroidales bacterium]|nr:pyruvate, water dikinase regulatory protein [Bacteroidales bacterium]